MKRSANLLVHPMDHAYIITVPYAKAGNYLVYGQNPYTSEYENIGPFPGTQQWISSPKLGRLYFGLQSVYGDIHWSASTAVEIPGIENFRDLGGYLTQEGRQVKWGRLFRSGVVETLDGEAKNALQRMNISHIFDYRSLDEAAKAPDAILPGAVHHALPAIKADAAVNKLTDMDMVSRIRSIRTLEEGEAMWEDFTKLYTELPFHNKAYQTLFDTLLENPGPVLQHCTAGKDRTGVGCALTLLALGVDESTVMEDYLLSSIFRKEANARYLNKLAEAGVEGPALEVVRKMLVVSTELLGRTLRAIKVKYTDYDTFFREEYALTANNLDQLRNDYTI